MPSWGSGLASQAVLVAFSLVALVVASLPGTTSAALIPARPQEAAGAGLPAPILIDVQINTVPLRPQPEADEPPPALPGAEASYFAEAQIVSIYGHPGIAEMGELGKHEPAAAADVVFALAAEYDALNGERGVIPAFHLIVDVAQANPQSDGSYLIQTPLSEIQAYVEVARERDMLLFLDLQIGWGNLMQAVHRLRGVLAEPFVHLALDPEFSTRHRAAAPGIVIGALEASMVNRVQHYLAGLVRWYGLPPKILVLHQFLPEMLPGAEAFQDFSEVEISVDMDGFGSPGAKLGGYERYALSDYSEHPAIKLFYLWDSPLILPDELMQLERPPEYVIYQ